MFGTKARVLVVPAATSPACAENPCPAAPATERSLAVDTQEELDALAGLTSAEDIYIFGPVTDLSPLSCLDSVDFLTIRKTKLTDLTQLASLRRIEQRLSVSLNDELISLDGLEQVSSIRTVVIGDNAALQNLDGLGSVKGAVNDIGITLNPSLRDISGLGGVTSAIRVNILSNAALESVQTLAALEHVDLGLEILNNASLPLCDDRALAARVTSNFAHRLQSPEESCP